MDFLQINMECNKPACFKYKILFTPGCRQFIKYIWANSGGVTAWHATGDVKEDCSPYPKQDSIHFNMDKHRYYILLKELESLGK